MSFLSKIGSFLSKVWSQIKDAIAKVMEALGPFLPILIIAVFLFAPYLSGLFAVGSFGAGVFGAIASLGTYGALALGVGVSYLILPEETTALIESVGEVAGVVVGAVAGAVVTGVSSLLGGNRLMYSAAGHGLYWYVNKDPSDEEPSKAGDVEVSTSDGTSTSLSTIKGVTFG